MHPSRRKVTTVMMRNLPNKYTQQMLLEELQMHGFNLQADFDFFYLPMDHSNAVNLGYCFINFVDTPVANAFAGCFMGKRMRRFNSSKTVVVMPASIQGYERNYGYYSSTRVAQAEDPQYRPLFARPTPMPEANQYEQMIQPVWEQQQQQQQQQRVPLPYKEEGDDEADGPLEYDTDEEVELWAVKGCGAGGYHINFRPPDAAQPAEFSPYQESLHTVGPHHLYVRNTFFQTPPERSPSVEPFLAERQVKSCPASGVHSEAGSARIEALMPRSGGSRGGQSFLAGDFADGHRHTFNMATLSKELPVPENGGRSSGSSTGTSKRSTSEPNPQPGLGSSSSGSVDVHTGTAPSENDGFALGSPELPCKGSVLHRWGACKPCAFFQAPEDKGGCKNGIDCTFCHLCEPGEKKRRKKVHQATKSNTRDRRGGDARVVDCHA
mmetsp:Transcript_86572/g.225930  ORF Transcript_86572/g.225930 Transcript_86572/m.225930 type:complete len:437 (+) Transcript_86572:217-1527(+)